MPRSANPRGLSAEPPTSYAWAKASRSAGRYGATTSKVMIGALTGKSNSE